MAKTQLEVKLASTVGGNKKGFVLFLIKITSKEGPEKNIVPLLLENGCLTNRHIGKAETFNVAFASVFNTDDKSWDQWSPEFIRA